MGKLTIIYWRDIPAQVVGQQGRKRHKQVLEQRFAVAIERLQLQFPDDVLEATVKAGGKLKKDQEYD